MLTAAAYAVTFAVLVAAVAYTVWDERRQARRRQARRHTCTQDDVDRLAAECRDSPPQNHAWPPIERLPASAECPECTWWYGGAPVYWPCPPHDPQFVTEWERRYAE